MRMVSGNEVNSAKDFVAAIQHHSRIKFDSLNNLNGTDSILTNPSSPKQIKMLSTHDWVEFWRGIYEPVIEFSLGL